jgi:hypothetical protein
MDPAGTEAVYIYQCWPFSSSSWISDVGRDVGYLEETHSPWLSALPLTVVLPTPLFVLALLFWVSYLTTDHHGGRGEHPNNRCEFG